MIGGGVQDIKARIGLEGAPQFAGQAKAAADSLGQISTQLGRVAASAEDIGRLGAGMAEMQADARASAQALQQLVGRMGEVQAASERASRASNFMDRFGPGAVGIGGLLALKAAVVGVADEMVRVQVRAETLESSLRFAIGADTAREMAYLRRVTHELGLEFTSSARAYAGFAAAAKETKLEGAGARQVFESVASAAAVMGLSADNAQGVLLALQQMMSKGTVQAEELRGQLGERLPGAFQIAARAMGVTTGELGKMLEQGKVLAEDFLPKFAAQLRTELGDGAAASANRTEAAINRLGNAWERFKGADNGATAGFFAGQLNIATDALNDFSGSVEDARAKGDGFFGQFVAGLGAIARFANPFNALSYGAQDVGAKLRAAEEDLARLQRKVQEEPGNIFTRMLIRDAEQLIERLRQAKQAKDALGDIGAGGGRGFVNPQTVGASLAERADLEAKLTEIRNKGLGVNKEWIASLQQLDAMQRTGLITEAERIKLAQDLTASTYKASRATSDAYGDLARDIAKTIALNDARAQGAGAITKGQELELQLNNRLADSLGKLSGAQAEGIRQLIARAKASADAADATEREQRLAEQLARARAAARGAEDRAIDEHLDKLEQERRAALKSVQDRVASLQDEAAAVELTAGTNLTLAEGIEMVALARAREKLERYYEGSAPWEDVQKEIEARERLLGLMADKRVREAGIKAAEETADYWRRISDDAGKALAEAIFDGGKSAGELLEDYFRTLVLRPLVEFAGQQGMAALLGLLGVNAGGKAAGGGGGANWLGMASNARLGASSVSWGSYAGWAALIALGVAKAMDDYDEGFRSEGVRQLQDDLGGGAQGWILGGLTADFSNLAKKIGFNDKWADLLSGATVVAKLFGRALPRVDAQGVSGSITDGDFSGQMFADVVQKGGIFRSDKRWTELAALPDDLGRFLDAGAADMVARARQFGDALGLPGQQLGKVTSDLRIEFAKPENDTKEAIAEATRKNLSAIAEALGEYGDDLVQSWAAAVGPVAQYGESAAQTIARVGQALLDVNSVLESIGVAALAASVDGGAAAVALADLFGGVQGLQQAAGSYAQNFLSEAERLDIVRGQLTQAFAEYGAALPPTREQFRGLVEAQDLTTESGRRAYAALLGVADAFAAITEPAGDAAAILRERQDLERDLLELQGNSVELRRLEREAISESNRALYDQVQALRDAAQFQSGIDAIYGAVNIDRSPEMGRRAADFRRLQGDPIVQDVAARTRAEWIEAFTRGGQGLSDFARGYTETQVSRAVSSVTDQLIQRQERVQAEGVANRDKVEQAAQQRAAAMAQQNNELIRALDGLTMSLDDYLRQLTTGSMSALSPERQYEAARVDFEAISRQAMAGDQAATEELQSRAATFLQESRAFYGGGAGFAGDSAAVVDVLNRVLDMLGQLNGNAEASASINLQGFARVADTTASTTAAVRSQSDRALLLAQRGVE